MNFEQIPVPRYPIVLNSALAYNHAALLYWGQDNYNAADE